MELIQAFLTENPCYQANLNKADSRYTAFQATGPRGLMLHSVGCAQSSARVFADRWNKAGCTVCVHAFVDAQTGAVLQTLPWSYRGWHCGSGANGSANNTHVGVELCESKYIKYTAGAKFEILDREKALADCRRTWETAVELFAFLCREFGIDPETGILSHKEGGKQGLASGHVDPEHYWQGLGTDYTMDRFRAAVQAKLAAAPDPSGPLYRVQVGAFRNKAYAEAFLKTVQKHFPGAFLKTEAGD